MGFHNGAWFPLFVPDFYGLRCSQHPFDPYSLTHILHGFFFFLLLVFIPDAVSESKWGVELPWWWVYIGAALVSVVLEISWEIFENSETVIQRFRSTSGLSVDYKGDSIQNAIGDVICAISGYWICLASVIQGVTWLPVVWFCVSELFLAIAIRDGLVIIMIQLAFPSDKIRAWQKNLLDRKERESKKATH